jgi:hypothetical protein
MPFPMSDVVVLIPGIMGSVLERDGKALWALTPGAALRAVLSLGKSIQRLELDGDDPEADDLGDGIVATRLMPDLHVVPGLDWKIDGYGRIRDCILGSFECIPGQNYFELPYDWRRDNRVAARALATKSPGWLAEWRQKSGNADAKLILICHSMGGIVARLFLELLDGWKVTRKLVTFGTPYSGSVNAADFLFNGFRKNWGPFTYDLTKMLRSLTSIYQLLPAYRCLRTPQGGFEPLDSVEWHRDGVDNARLRQAIELHRSLRKAVDARVNSGAESYEIRPVVGDAQPTRYALRRVRDTVEALYERSPEEYGGDGTVPRVSACPPELLDGWVNAMFSPQIHGSLQNDRAVLAHLTGALRVGPNLGPPVFAVQDLPVALQADDVSSQEPLVVRARPQGSDRAVQVRLEAAGDPNFPAHSVELKGESDGWQSAEVYGLPAGDYRVMVTTPGLHRSVALASVVDLGTLQAEAGV